MRQLFILAILIVLFPDILLSQKKENSSTIATQVNKKDQNTFLRVELDSTCNMNFLGIRVRSVIFVGTKQNAKDFFKRFFDFIGGSDALLSRDQYFDSFEERGFAKKVTTTSNLKHYLIAVSIPDPDDFSRVLSHVRTQRVSNNIKCDSDECIKICNSGKVCISIECSDYSTEICYDGKFEATFSNGTFNFTFPTKTQ